MDEKRLEVFLSVCRNRSCNKAAKELFMAPQGVSKSLQKLEDELGVTLFTRTSNYLEPNRNAELFSHPATD